MKKCEQGIPRPERADGYSPFYTNDIPAVGRFGIMQGDPGSFGRAILIRRLKAATTEDIQEAERELAHHPSVRTWGPNTQPASKMALKALATIRQELADRGHPVSDFPERAHKRGPLAMNPAAIAKRASNARLKAWAAAAPREGPHPNPPWLQQPNETKHEEEPK